MSLFSKANFKDIVFQRRPKIMPESGGEVETPTKYSVSSNSPLEEKKKKVGKVVVRDNIFGN